MGPRPITGWRRLLLETRFVLAHLKYVWDRGAYPQFGWRGGLAAVLSFLRHGRQFQIKKPMAFGGSYFVSVTVPHWPSPAYDRMVAGGGLDFRAAGTPRRPQIDFVILSLSRRCRYRCEHCYERHSLAARESVPLSGWQAVVRELQRIGTSVIVFSGGEPLERYADLLALVDRADKDLSDLQINTSGAGLTATRARELRAAGLTTAGVGLDDPCAERNDSLRGFAGAHRIALRALDLFREAGVFTYVNACLSPDLVRSGRLSELLALGRRHSVGIIRLLEPKPVGGYFGASAESLFTPEDRERTVAFLRLANSDRRWARHPLVAYPAHDEAPERLGCYMGGLGHLAVDGRGNVLPCIFAPVSFGNVTREPFAAILARMRSAYPRPMRVGCPTPHLMRILHQKRAVPADLPVPFEQVEEAWRPYLTGSTARREAAPTHTPAAAA